MCGLAGYLTHKNKKLTDLELAARKEIFNTLLVAMEQRGNQSAGVAFISPTDQKIVKNTLSASAFIKTKRYKKEINSDYPLVIGHTRLATTGAVTKENAHPFRRGNIIGVHNGFVFNWEDLKNTQTQVDSEVIFDQLAKYRNNYKVAFSKLDGIFALAWTNLIKNDYQVFLAVERNPLYLALIPELDTMFWASTQLALTRALDTRYPGYKLKYAVDNWVLKFDSSLKMTSKYVLFKPYKFKQYSLNETYSTSSDSHTTELKSPIFCHWCGYIINQCQCIEVSTKPNPIYCGVCDILIMTDHVHREKGSGEYLCDGCNFQLGYETEKIWVEDIIRGGTL